MIDGRVNWKGAIAIQNCRIAGAEMLATQALYELDNH